MPPPRLYKAALPARPVTRFAPSPTGHLHLGHVANAVWTWGLARALGGTVVLRMEDHDRGRCRPEYEASILKDLAWLGLAADRGEAELRSQAPCAFRQSDHGERYMAALARLEERGTVYGCGCSRKAIQTRTGQAEGEENPYDNYCRALGISAGPELGLRVPLPGHEVTFLDALLGEIRQCPARQCGDLLVRERNGYWTYQFCVVVDDAADGVDLVVRGQDLLASTGRQILLRELLGEASGPAYVHHPLIRAVDGQKLSKRDAAQGIRELRGAGRGPASVLGEAAHRTGLLATPEEVCADDLAGLFSAML